MYHTLPAIILADLKWFAIHSLCTNHALDSVLMPGATCEHIEWFTEAWEAWIAWYRCK